MDFQTTPTKPYPNPPGRLVLCALCAMVMALPLTCFVPLSQMLVFRLGSEEETHSFETLIETVEVRRKVVMPVPLAKVLLIGPAELSACSLQGPTNDRSEFHNLNGTGARLRC